MRSNAAFFIAAVLMISEGPIAAAQGQSSGTQAYVQYGEPPVMDNTIFYHLLFNQFEGRTNGPDNAFRWDGEGWIGTDMNRLWFKSEGFIEHGRMTDGDQEVLYGRPIPHMTLIRPFREGGTLRQKGCLGTAFPQQQQPFRIRSQLKLEPREAAHR